MAAPNLLGTTTVTGKTALATLTTVTANVLTNSSSSGTVDKLNSVVLSNYSGSTVTANVMINRSATVYYVGGNISIPANSTLVLLGKDTSLYLEEGDVLQANVSANTSISMSASYELMS
jgi:redox-sensitive bicupin YhaK (pirin superfamily)